MAGISWYVYILECCDRSFYTGITNDLKDRLGKHNAGIASAWTSRRGPVRMVYAEDHPNKSSARKREIEIKGWRRQKKIALISSKRNILHR